MNTSNAFLYAKLNNKNVESLDLSTSSIIVRKSYKITVSANAYSATLESDIDLTLEPFDEEDYTLAFTGGTVESLNNQKVAVSGRTIALAGLSGNGDAILTVTYKKVNTTEKAKIYNRCESLVIGGSTQTSSGIGRTTLNDGLLINNYYGLRVQDKIISLNIPDVVDVLGIYESGTINDPVLPRIHFSALNSSIGNLIKGEKIIGSNTGAVAAFVSSDGINSVEIVYLNENRFALNEEVTFQETSITGTISAVDVGDKNIKDNFILDNGQRPEIYDYSRLIRKSQVSSPTKKIRVIYNCYSISPSSEGDFVSVDSYGRDRYGYDISTINGVRNSDMIDLRPRVTSFNPDTADKSPFEFNARLFALNANSSNSIVAKDRTINLSYNYYLPRIDKLFLTKEGTFSLNSGIPSLSPKAPNKLDSALEVATIYYPAYLYNVKDVRVSLSTHKRYTMKDISRIEDRLSNVEFYSSLSLLETDTKNLTIKDPKTGLDKFKSGFFVDNFKSYDGGDLSNPVYRASVDTAYGYRQPRL